MNQPRLTPLEPTISSELAIPYDKMTWEQLQQVVEANPYLSLRERIEGTLPMGIGGGVEGWFVDVNINGRNWGAEPLFVDQNGKIYLQKSMKAAGMRRRGVDSGAFGANVDTSEKTPDDVLTIANFEERITRGPVAHRERLGRGVESVRDLVVRDLQTLLNELE